MKTHTSSFKEQIKLIGKEIDSRITFGSTVLGKDDLNAVTPSYQGAILKSVMKQLDIDSNVEIPIGTILKYEFGLKVNGEYEYINYGNYVVYSIEKQEDTNSYKITCYDKLLYSMLDYVKLPITYPISIRDYINSLSTALGLKFANKSETFANYDKQIQADLYDGLGYTFRDVLDELAQVTASTICLNNNDELEIRYITETNDTIDEEFLKDVNVNFGEKFGAVNTIVLSRSGDSDSVYYPSVLPSNPYEIKISDNQIMNGNDRADFLPDIYNKLNGLEFYTNDFVSKGICYYDLCDRYSVKVGDNTYSCVMFNDEVLVTQGLEENVYTELPEQTETDYKHASKDDRMINQVYIIAKKNEAEILALVSTTETIQKEINPTKDESGSEIIIEDASNNPLTYLEIDGKSTQETRSGKNLFSGNFSQFNSEGGTGSIYGYFKLEEGTQYTLTMIAKNDFNPTTSTYLGFTSNGGSAGQNYKWAVFGGQSTITKGTKITITNVSSGIFLNYVSIFSNNATTLKTFVDNFYIQLEKGSEATSYEPYTGGQPSPNPDYPSEIECVKGKNLIPNNWKLADANYTKEYGKLIVSGNLSTSYLYGGTTNFIDLTLKSGTYTFSASSNTFSNIYAVVNNNGIIENWNNGITKTFTSDVVVQSIRCNEATLSTGTYLWIAQIEKSTVATGYVPYNTIQIKDVGKNLYNDNFKDYTRPLDYLIHPITLEQGQAYTLKATLTGTKITGILVGIAPTGEKYADFKNRLFVAINSGGNTEAKRTITIDETWTSPKLVVYCPPNSLQTTFESIFENYEIQLEKGTQATEYEPYQENTLNINLQGNELCSLPNNVKDELVIENGRAKIIKNVGKYNITGNEAWALSGTESQPYINFGNYVDNCKYPATSTTLPNLLSNYYLQIARNNLYNGRITLSPSKALIIYDTVHNTSLANFKTWLKSAGVVVYYQLATPTEIDLGDSAIPYIDGINYMHISSNMDTTFSLVYPHKTISGNAYDYTEFNPPGVKQTGTIKSYNAITGIGTLMSQYPFMYTPMQGDSYAVISNIYNVSGFSYLYNTPYNTVNSLYTHGYTATWATPDGLCVLPDDFNITLQFSPDGNFFYDQNGVYQEVVNLITTETDDANNEGEFTIKIDKNKLIFVQNPDISLELPFYTNTTQVFVLSSASVAQINNDYVWDDTATWTDTYTWVEGGTSLERVCNHWWKVQITNTGIKIEEIFPTT